MPHESKIRECGCGCSRFRGPHDPPHTVHTAHRQSDGDFLRTPSPNVGLAFASFAKKLCTHVDETFFLWVHRQERQTGALVGSLTRQRLAWLAKMGDSGMSLFALSLEQLTQLKQSIEEVRLTATMNAAPV